MGLSYKSLNKKPLAFLASTFETRSFFIISIIDFNLCMIITIRVSYDLGSVATLKSLPESPHVHFKHADF